MTYELTPVELDAEGWPILNFKPGDRVRVGPSAPRKRDSFDARVDRVDGDEVHVMGPRGFKVVKRGRIEKVL